MACTVRVRNHLLLRCQSRILFFRLPCHRVDTWFAQSDCMGTYLLPVLHLMQADKEETGDVGFALYEKVHRAKNRWRCNLRYGVFLINGKECMFNKGSTDFTF